MSQPYSGFIAAFGAPQILVHPILVHYTNIPGSPFLKHSTPEQGCGLPLSGGGDGCVEMGRQMPPASPASQLLVAHHHRGSPVCFVERVHF